MIDSLFIWGSIVAWNVTALLFSIDSLRVYLRSQRECRALSQSENGRKLVAIGRMHIARWFVAGALLGLLTGIISAFRLTIPDLDSPLALMIGASTRVLIVIMFFAFWRAKRTNLNLYGQAADYYRSRIRQ